MDHGYDEEYEDRLFDAIQWPHAGYRLFEIGHFVGDRDWFDGVWESNCIFVTREQLEQVGGFDESFSMAGGGYANLELYERLGYLARHHGRDDHRRRLVPPGARRDDHEPDRCRRTARSACSGTAEHYAELRGRLFRGPGKPLHFVGRIMSEAARRSKPRRMSTATFAEGAEVPGARRPPGDADTGARGAGPRVHRSGVAQPAVGADDLARPAHRDRADRPARVPGGHRPVRPDWVVETGTGDGGRALFLASICELVGHGEVISIDDRDGRSRPDREPSDGRDTRVRYVEGSPHDPDVAAGVRDLVGGGTAVVVLGSRTDRLETHAEFEAYAPLVPVGSYVIVADTS